MTNLSSLKKCQTNTPMQLVTVTAPLCSFLCNFGSAEKESQQDQRLGESAVVHHLLWLEPLHRIADFPPTVLSSAPLHLLILTNFYLT